MVETPEDIELDLLLEAIWRRTHYDFRSYSRGSIGRRLEQTKLRLGCETLSELQHRVLYDPDIVQDLLNVLTIQVSEMFRDPAYFRALREKVVPHLRTWPSIKVWIAGCSEGEELYSMAILFREEGLESRTTFYATDVNPNALRRAQAGVYDLDRIPLFTENHRASGGKSSLSDYYTAAYGAAKFDKTLRQRCVFSDHNLATDHVFTEAHLISCRNVLIYFDRSLQDRAVGLFAGSLASGGFLGLGSKETLRFSSYADAFSEFDAEQRIYRAATARAAAA